ncbi:MAG: tRNA 2-thiocytidine biosynthesis protein TtcA [Candidatus Cloacimonetes bacterium]|nr:tRNA 2-thiocytidine biosynthesis protein TtcA [Candidatus Cloacimonadota bacterium]
MRKIIFNKNYGKWFINDVLRAIRTYKLLLKEESLAVALSGGKDSATLLYILSYLNTFSDLSFSLSAAHIKIADYDTSSLKAYCEELGVHYFEDSLDPDDETIENCYICSRLKRGALSSLLSSKGIHKVAYGHHATDVAETFLMNIIKNKKLGSLTPKVEIPESTMTIIRPMIYLDEEKIVKIHSHLGLPNFNIPCPYKKTTIREKYKRIIQVIDRGIPDAHFSQKVIETLEGCDLKDWKD